MKKRYLIILAVIIVLVVSVFVGIKLFSSKDINNKGKNNDVEIKEPASNTDELISSSNEIANANVKG